MKKIIFISLFLIGLNVVSQNDYTSAINRDSDALAKAFLKNDFKTIANFTHKSILNLIGGKENMASVLTQEMEKMIADGYGFKDVKIGPPRQIYTAGDELHCLVSQKIVLSLKDEIITANSYLLAISSDKGKTWTFIDTAKINNENILELLPHFNTNLKFPKKAALIITKNEE
ncbi:MAG: hypothetical protein V3U80_06700 [Flavobacteriaceae bacterium]